MPARCAQPIVVRISSSEYNVSPLKKSTRRQSRDQSFIARERRPGLPILCHCRLLVSLRLPIRIDYLSVYPAAGCEFNVVRLGPFPDLRSVAAGRTAWALNSAGASLNPTAGASSVRDVFPERVSTLICIGVRTVRLFHDLVAQTYHAVFERCGLDRIQVLPILEMRVPSPRDAGQTSRVISSTTPASNRECMSFKLPHSQMSLPLCSLSLRMVATGSRVTVAAGKSAPGDGIQLRRSDELGEVVELLAVLALVVGVRPVVLGLGVGIRAENHRAEPAVLLRGDVVDGYPLVPAGWWASPVEAGWLAPCAG